MRRPVSFKRILLVFALVSSALSASSSPEPDEFQVSLLHGSVLFRETVFADSNATYRPLASGTSLPSSCRVSCRSGAELLLREGPRSLRFLQGAAFDASPRTLTLLQGALLLDQREKAVLDLPAFHLAGPEAEVLLSGRGVLLAETLVSGGLKLIVAAGSFRANAPGGEKSVAIGPGALLFVKPYGKGFGAPIHLNLETLVATAALVHEFPNPPDLLAELAHAVAEQKPLLKKKYRARVGDSVSPDHFELHPLRKIRP